MPDVIVAIVLASYASLAFELFVLRVPSVASSVALWTADPAIVAMYSRRYRRLFALDRAMKVLLFSAPLVITWGVYLYPLLVIVFRPNLLGDDLFAPSAWTSAAAAVAMLAGRAFALRAALTIRRQNAQREESFHLHTAGVFRWSRNPGLVGMYLFVTGLWLAAPSATLAVGIVVYVLYMDFKIRMEEDFLQHKFGQPYLDYCARTGRYLR